MTGLETAFIIGAGVIVSFTFGFLFGMGYQSAEEVREIKNITNRSRKTIEDMKNRSIKAVEEAYQDKRQKEEAISLIYNIFDDDVKYGGF